MVFTSHGSTPMTVVPKLGLRWDITDSLALKNNYFRSFKYPEFEELYWTGGGGFGNPNLKPEDGWGGDIGTEWRITEKIKLENVFFTQWLQDSIHWYSGNGGIWRPENVERRFFSALTIKSVLKFRYIGDRLKKFPHRFRINTCTVTC
jgi:outer membrane receptor protein involved in Fe transport